jgi:hypothetical protein
MKAAILALAILVPIAAADAVAADAAPSSTVVTRLGVSSTEFSCSDSAGRECHYLILHSLCNERFLAPGQKERSCTYSEAAPPFRIKSGERKKISGLAQDYLYTMKVGAAPTVQDVLREPIKH